MRYALISDIHGNLEALQAVMTENYENDQVDQVVFLGDAVGYGASPNEVVEIIESSCSIKLMGNHDYCCIGLMDTLYFNEWARESAEFTISKLTPETNRIISAFQMTAEIEDVFLVHATPASPEEWDYCLTKSEADRQFKHFRNKACFIGHSHQSLIFSSNGDGRTAQTPSKDFTLEEGHRYLINVGSVGQPRDNDPRAAYVVFDSERKSVKFRRVSYDIEAAQAKMIAAGLPAFLVERLRIGR